MLDAKEINEIAKAIVNQNYDYDYIGLRVQESDYGWTVGQMISYQSKIWIDGEETEDEIGGICAVDAEQASSHILGFGAYTGDTIVVLASNAACRGEDDGEIILKSSSGSMPVVLDIINL